MDDTDATAPPEDAAPDISPGKLEPQPADKTEPYDEITSELGPDDTDADGQPNPPEETPEQAYRLVPRNDVKRADLPWQVVQLSESLPDDVVLVGYFLIGADHVLMTDKGFYGLHEGSLTALKPYVIVDN